MTGTFVYDGMEVKKTGRTAVKTIKSAGATGGRTFTIFEITPVDTFGGVWKKWVPETELFTVQP